jgi:hypothetical protein
VQRTRCGADHGHGGARADRQGQQRPVQDALDRAAACGCAGFRRSGGEGIHRAKFYRFCATSDDSRSTRACRALLSTSNLYLTRGLHEAPGDGA